MLRYVSDYHTHTYISGDSKSTLMENARAAGPEKGREGKSGTKQGHRAGEWPRCGTRRGKVSAETR